MPQRSKILTLNTVQRLFSMFPQGGPGLALLLLRISVAATFFIEAACRSGVSLSPILLVAVSAPSVSIAIGFATPLLSFVVGVSAALGLLTHLRLDNLILGSLILNATALSLLGPGAYSIDARLFGRRVLIATSPKDETRL